MELGLGLVCPSAKNVILLVWVVLANVGLGLLKPMSREPNFGSGFNPTHPVDPNWQMRYLINPDIVVSIVMDQPPSPTRDEYCC